MPTELRDGDYELVDHCIEHDSIIADLHAGVPCPLEHKAENDRQHGKR
jgi:hypothetical protein